ncbi:MAG: sigma-70 family RNA polymerase sigma factor [Desulfobulbaceae bacterium]
MERSDEEIVGRVVAGRTKEFGILVERYQRQVFNLMYRFSRSDHEAADLTQEVFLRAFEKIGSFRKGTRFFPWLYTLALNRARDWSRKGGRRRRYESENDWNGKPAGAALESTAEEILLRAEDVRRLRQALDLFPDDMRELLLLRYQHECSVSEVAEIFSISESAVKMRTSRGLKRLQELMKKQ